MRRDQDQAEEAEKTSVERCDDRHAQRLAGLALLREGVAVEDGGRRRRRAGNLDEDGWYRVSHKAARVDAEQHGHGGHGGEDKGDGQHQAHRHRHRESRRRAYQDADHLAHEHGEERLPLERLLEADK